MTAPLPRELLTSELHDDGVWHARYPTATETLCGRPALEEPRRGRRRAPGCGLCSLAARRFDAIDKSCPDYWRTEV